MEFGLQACSSLSSPDPFASRMQGVWVFLGLECSLTVFRLVASFSVAQDVLTTGGATDLLNSAGAIFLF